MEYPLCVSHSVHANTQAWHPMQRVASMKNSMFDGTAIAYLVNFPR